MTSKLCPLPSSKVHVIIKVPCVLYVNGSDVVPVIVPEQLSVVEGVVAVAESNQSTFPEDVIASAKVATGEVMSELAMRDELTGKIVSSYRNAAIHLGKWSDVSVKSFLQARS